MTCWLFIVIIPLPLHFLLWYLVSWLLQHLCAYQLFSTPSSGRDLLCMPACHLSLWTAWGVSFRLKYPASITLLNRVNERGNQTSQSWCYQIYFDSQTTPTSWNNVLFSFPLFQCLYLCLQYHTSTTKVILLPLKNHTHTNTNHHHVLFYYKNKHQNEQRNSDNKTQQGERQKKTIVT